MILDEGLSRATAQAEDDHILQVSELHDITDQGD